MISNIVKNQRKYYLSGNTLDIKKRIIVLEQIKEQINKYYSQLVDAFEKDFNKCEFDVISTEVSMVIFEIDYFIKNIKKLSRTKRVRSNLINIPSKSYIYKEPYGCVLVIAPWNYPFQLSVLPLVDAIASGNTVVLKPSEQAPHVASVIEKMLSIFDDGLIKVVNGGIDVSSALLDERFDLIFYTGGTNVGKVVMEKASRHLTPVILELGGKSPCIVCKDADIKLAAKRIVWGKFINAGQTCVAPDYILVHECIKEEFIKNVIEQINENYYINNTLSKDFPSIINEKHLDRLKKLINKDKVIFGGNIYNKTLEPTVLDNVCEFDLVMQEEIFGPIMPIIAFNDLDKVVNTLKQKEKPLALYIFSKNKENINKVINNLSFGGASINDVIMHLTNDLLPFGGIGNSGMGRYHGKYSFDAFTHEKPVFKKGKFELNIKYNNRNDNKTKLLKKILKIKEEK